MVTHTSNILDPACPEVLGMIHLKQIQGLDQVIDPEVSGFTLTDTESDTSSDDIDSIPEFVPRRGLGLNSTNLGYTSTESNDSLLALDW